MGWLRKMRWLVPALIGLGCALLVSTIGQGTGRADNVPLSIKIVGNHFVNGAGQTIRLIGVNHESFEYACEEGFGYDDGNMTDADAAAIAAWGANAVRVPLNEDCWLGLHGVPTTDDSPQHNPTGLTVAGYRQAVEDYVQDLHNHGMYAILDLHWSGGGTDRAAAQQPMPDANSPTFWTSVATTFKNDPAVVFDVFNEPFDPTDPNSQVDTDPLHKVSWDCWENGGCTTDEVGEDGQPLQNNMHENIVYNVTGMQAQVDAIRNAGATQPVMVGGLDFSNDLSQWADHAPDDPLNQEAASFHNYEGQPCGPACWDSVIAPIAQNVPVVTGEFGESNYMDPDCNLSADTGYDEQYMTWADQHGISYTAWGWAILGPDDLAGLTCDDDFYLNSAPDGTPASANGIDVHAHLIALAGGGTTSSTTTTTPPGTTTSTATQPPPTTSTTTTTPPGGSAALQSLTAKVARGGGSVTLTLSASQNAAATVSGQTVKKFPAGHGKKRQVSLGASTGASLTANRPATATLKLSRAAHQLLTKHHKLKVQLTVTLVAGGTRSVATRTLTLALPKPPHKHKKK